MEDEAADPVVPAPDGVDHGRGRRVSVPVSAFPEQQRRRRDVPAAIVKHAPLFEQRRVFVGVSTLEIAAAAAVAAVAAVARKDERGDDEAASAAGVGSRSEREERRGKRRHQTKIACIRHVYFVQHSMHKNLSS